MADLIQILRHLDIQPTPQRLAVAEVVLSAGTHPTADEVWAAVRETSPTVSRATVYNTLNLFVQKGLLRPQILREGTIVFDPNVGAHHHFVDDETGEIHDLPGDTFTVTPRTSLDHFEVREIQVVVRGKRRKGPDGS